MREGRKMEENIVDTKAVYIERINKVMGENGILINEFDADERLELDSLTQVSLLVCFENEFDFEFPDSELLEIPETYNGLVQLVLKNLGFISTTDDRHASSLVKGGDSNEET